MSRRRRDTTKGEPRIPELVDTLLAERQRLLVAFCKLAGVEPFSDKRAVTYLLQEFCQQLMDYTALGYFELLAQLGDEGAAAPERRLLSELYPALNATTDLAVQFNDQYDSSSHVLDLAALDQDLSRIGETLAARFELEDRVIAAVVRA